MSKPCTYNQRSSEKGNPDQQKGDKGPLSSQKVSKSNNFPNYNNENGPHAIQPEALTSERTLWTDSDTIVPSRTSISAASQDFLDMPLKFSQSDLPRQASQELGEDSSRNISGGWNIFTSHNRPRIQTELDHEGKDHTLDYDLTFLFKPMEDIPPLFATGKPRSVIIKLILISVSQKFREVVLILPMTLAQVRQQSNPWDSLFIRWTQSERNVKP